MTAVSWLSRVRVDQADAADRHYLEAQTSYEAIGADTAASTPRLNRVLLAFSKRRFQEAFDLAEAALPIIKRSNQRAFLGCVRLTQLPKLGLDAQWTLWDEYVEVVEKSLRSSGFVDADVAIPAEVAAEIALQAGELDRAKRVLDLALWQWRSLGKPSEAVRVEARISTL